jgi:phage I-like protein
MVSAPVSREVPNANGKRPDGKVRLTPQEVEAAKISGITVEEYAKNKLLKEKMVASGEYGEQR